MGKVTTIEEHFIVDNFGDISIKRTITASGIDAVEFWQDGDMLLISTHNVKEFTNALLKILNGPRPQSEGESSERFWNNDQIIVDRK